MTADMSWIKTTVVDEPMRLVDGQAHITIEVRIEWWRWSFVRFVRDSISIEPTWLSWAAWLVAIWLVVTHGPAMNRGR